MAGCRAVQEANVRSSRRWGLSAEFDAYLSPSDSHAVTLSVFKLVTLFHILNLALQLLLRSGVYVCADALDSHGILARLNQIRNN